MFSKIACTILGQIQSKLFWDWFSVSKVSCVVSGISMRPCGIHQPTPGICPTATSLAWQWLLAVPRPTQATTGRDMGGRGSKTDTAVACRSLGWAEQLLSAVVKWLLAGLDWVWFIKQVCNRGSGTAISYTDQLHLQLQQEVAERLLKIRLLTDPV